MVVGKEALGSDFMWEGEEGPEPDAQVPGSRPPARPCPHPRPRPQVNSGIYQFCTEIAAYILHLFSGLTAGSDSLRLHSAGLGRSGQGGGPRGLGRPMLRTAL